MIHRFYRQRLDEPVASFAFRKIGGRGWGQLMVVDSEGTIILADGNTVKWCKRNGAVSASEPANEGIRRVYTDGIVVQAGSRSVNDGKGIEAARAMFIPFNKTALDVEHAVELAHAGQRNLMYSEPARHGDVLAWMTADKFQFFNVRTRSSSTVPLDDKNQTELNLRNASVTAFDGETILVGSNVVVDAKTGNRFASNWNDKRINGLFTTRNRIGYRLKDGRLEAIDLMHQNHPPEQLAKVPYPPVFQNDSGLLIWTGANWKTMSWLKELGTQVQELKDLSNPQR